MRTTPLIAAAIFALLAPTSLDAGVMGQDFLTPGDSLLTYDDVNQREWLDLPYTFDSLSVVKSQMAPGQPLEGFHFASLEDVVNLNLSAEVSEVNDFSLPGIPGPGPKKLIDLVGYLVLAEGGILQQFQYTLGQITVGFSEGEPLFDEKNIVVFSVGDGSLLPGSINVPIGSVGNSSGGYFESPPMELLTGEIAGAGNTGPFWLYRETVPEPSSIILLTIAALALLSRRRVPLLACPAV